MKTPTGNDVVFWLRLSCTVYLAFPKALLLFLLILSVLKTKVKVTTFRAHESSHFLLSSSRRDL